MINKSPYPMVSVAEAQAAIDNALETLPSELAYLGLAHGRVLRADVHALYDMPSFAASLKDGYAIRACDADGGYDNILSIRNDLASHATSSNETQLPAPLGAGEAAYVATGAPIPPGADTVAMIEVCIVQPDNSTMRIESWPKLGTDIRAAGSDAKKGDVLIKSGAVLRAGELGLLAGAGIRQVTVTRMVRVGVLSSGDELYDAAVEDPLPRGAVRDSNRPMLLSLISEHLPGFAEGLDFGVVRDEKNTVSKALQDARDGCDVLITTGGVSMGEKDFIKPTLAETGNVHFGRVNMKPGKPLTFASFHKHQCVVALPGNPVSAFVCFHVAAARAIRILAGLPPVHMQQVQATLTHDFKRDRIRPEFHRAELTWCNESQRYNAVSTGKQASSRLLSVQAADALLFVPSGEEPITVGTAVTAHLLR